MSKLLEKIEKAGQPRTRHMGFLAPAQDHIVPLPLLVGVCKSDTGTVPAGLQGCLDGILWRLEDSEEIETLKVDESGPPWGVWIDTPTPALMKSLKDTGADFLLFSPEMVSIGLLKEKEIGKFLLVALELSDRLAPTLHDLLVDAVAVVLPSGTTLTVQQLMVISSLRGFFGKPFLLALGDAPTQEELEVLRDSGIEAILLDLDILDHEAIKDVRKAIDALPARDPNLDRGGATAILPQISGLEDEQFDYEEDDY